MKKFDYAFAVLMVVAFTAANLYADDFKSGATEAGSNPPAACTNTYAGTQWMDTDSGILYVCDTSNSRNKWLSVSEFHFMGSGDNTPCKDGDPPSDPQCTQAIEVVNANDMGYQIEQNATIVAGGFHADSSCTNGDGVDLEVANGENGAVAFLADIVTGCLDANGCQATGLNINLSAGDIIRAHLDNNCANGSNDVIDWGSNLIIRWRHD